MNRYMISIPLTLAEDLAKDGDQQKAKDGLRELLAARSALKFENQRIEPARFKCLACGDYHEGIAGKPLTEEQIGFNLCIDWVRELNQ